MADKQQIQGWLDKLRAGTLVEADLQQALDRLSGGTSDGDSPKQQRLLYLNTGNTGVDSQVLGMALGRERSDPRRTRRCRRVALQLRA